MNRFKTASILAFAFTSLHAFGADQADSKKEENESKVSSYNSAVKELKRIDGPMPLY